MIGVAPARIRPQTLLHPQPATQPPRHDEPSARRPALIRDDHLPARFLRLPGAGKPAAPHPLPPSGQPDDLREKFSTVSLVWADGGYAGRLVTWAKHVLGLAVTIVKRNDDSRGFVVLPRRWV
ncbi:hypothetical protein [Streptosporangium sp. KLBMP 9127]|nr:hypothetical protein [Streptosporangium sp. KLBMP 9127]